jgi:membrane peptidoglycan carboxypeptidase
MKPFVYLAAFREPGRDGGYWSPATRIEDEPREVKVGNRLWAPQNYDREFRGLVTVRQAIEQSLNVPTARVALEIGVDRVAGTAKDLGIRSPLEEVPSLALGTSEVTLLEITGAYAALAAAGSAHTPTLLRECADADGNAILLAPLEDPPGVRPAEAYLITRLLEGGQFRTRRPARELRSAGRWRKTGTTDDYRDAGLKGTTPIGRWSLGEFDRRRDVGLSGSAAALPIWAQVFREIRAGGPWREFTAPPGIVTALICPESGGKVTGNCPDWIEEEFLAGTEPQTECDLHGGGFLRRLRRFFGT